MLRKINNFFIERELFTLSIYFVFGLLIRLINIKSVSLVSDDYYSLYLSNHIHEMINVIRNGAHIGLYDYVFLNILKFFSNNIVFLRFFSALFSILSVFPLYFISKRLTGNKSTSFIASFLYIISNFSILYAQRLQPYSISIFFTLLSNYFFLNYEKKPFRYFFTIALSIYLHYFNIIFPLIHLIILIKEKKNIKKWILIISLIFIPMLTIILSNNLFKKEFILKKPAEINMQHDGQSLYRGFSPNSFGRLIFLFNRMISGNKLFSGVGESLSPISILCFIFIPFMLYFHLPKKNTFYLLLLIYLLPISLYLLGNIIQNTTGLQILRMNYLITIYPYFLIALAVFATRRISLNIVLTITMAISMIYLIAGYNNNEFENRDWKEFLRINIRKQNPLFLKYDLKEFDDRPIQLIMNQPGKEVKNIRIKNIDFHIFDEKLLKQRLKKLISGESQVWLFTEAGLDDYKKFLDKWKNIPYAQVDLYLLKCIDILKKEFNSYSTVIISPWGYAKYKLWIFSNYKNKFIPDVNIHFSAFGNIPIYNNCSFKPFIKKYANCPFLNLSKFDNDKYKLRFNFGILQERFPDYPFIIQKSVPELRIDIHYSIFESTYIRKFINFLIYIWQFLFIIFSIIQFIIIWKNK